MHLISTNQFVTASDIEKIFESVNLMRDPWSRGIDPVAVARGKVMAIIKDESSTRTRISFESAMKKLGGDVILVELDDKTSLAKGESLEDMVRTISSYVDIIVMRFKDKGRVGELAKYSSVPVINAGDGANSHPTQGLLDLYTIHREMRRVDNLCIMFVGDVKHSRTVNSLLDLLRLYEGMRCIFISPRGMKLEEESHNFCIEHGIGVTYYENLQYAMEQAEYFPDVVYMIREQKERHDGVLSRNYPIFGKNELSLLGKNSIVMHALPRGVELPVDIDGDSRCAIWRQVKNGLYLRMGLLYNYFTHLS